MNAEPLQNAADYFENGFDPADLGEYEPAYVSSVDYGRMFVIFVSGNMSMSELNTKLGLCLNGVSIGVGISNIITDEKLELTIFQQGGKTRDVNKLFEGKQGKLGVIGHVKEFFNGSEGEESVVQRVNDFLELDGDLLNPQPLSYHLKYLSDNEVIPAVVIEREGIIPAVSAKTVTLNLNGNLHLDLSDDAGMILPQTEPSEITLLWNSCFSGLITGTLDNEPISLDLYSYKCGIKSLQDLWKGGRLQWENTVKIHVLDSVSEMP